MSASARSPLRIGIVGVGPKGLYGLERLLAYLKANKTDRPLEIWLFERSGYFGAGSTYAPDQADYLLMNYAGGFINMWSSELPSPIVKEPWSFVEWLQQQTGLPTDQTAEDFQARRLVGEYLMEGFKQLKRHLPDSVVIREVVGEVVDLQVKDNYCRLVIKTEEGRKFAMTHFISVLLTTGHQRPVKQAENGQNDVRRINFVYPVHQHLAPLLASAVVAVKGMGLTFIDTALALTEGRGGTFESQAGGTLRYKPSGEEPKFIFPYSRSGLPVLPRLSTYESYSEPLKFFTAENLLRIDRKNDDRGWDFTKELLPLIRKEYRWSYYKQLFQNRELTLNFYDEWAKIEEQIIDFHYRFLEEIEFDLDQLLQPIVCPVKDRHQKTLAYLQHWISVIEDEPAHPLASSLHVWRRISPLFNQIYRFDGLAAEGQRHFLQYYAGHFNRISYGPPASNMRKIIALAEAGIIDFSYAKPDGISALNDQSGYILYKADQKVGIDFLVDARIPKTSLFSDVSELYTKLLDRGTIRPHQNRKSQSSSFFQPGCAEIDRQGRPLNRNGAIVSRITFYGTPTEGLTFDNDTLSRERNDFATPFAKNTLRLIKAYRLKLN